MSGGALKSALAESWYLVVILCVISLVVVYKLATGGEPVQEPGTTTVAGPRNIAGPAAAAAAVQPPTTEQDKARKVIAEHLEKFNADPRAKDAPALLAAIGNLNKQKLQNLEEAARNYELLIHDYPGWRGISQVYPQLMACYEKLGDDNGLRWLYKQMIEKFPPESNEYKYAKAKLD